MVDNVVALVDAKHGMEKLDEGESGQGTACAQICFSSTVLLNKIDLVDQEHLDKASHGHGEAFFSWSPVPLELRASLSKYDQHGQARNTTT